MKNFFALSIKAAAALFLCMVLLMSCKKGEAAAPGALDADTSYAFGMLIASQFSQMGFVNVRFDYNAFTEGFKAFIEAKETRMTTDAAMEKINTAFIMLQSQSEAMVWQEGEINYEAGEIYRAENGARNGVTTTSSGLQYEVITQGSGPRPGPMDTVRVHYRGSLIDGTEFDSSYSRGPAEFSLAEVISGWTEGVQLMNEGSTFRFVIPPNLAYGPSGQGIIPPSSTLIFTVELLAVMR